MTSFIKDGPDKRGRTHIIEGEKRPGQIFSIKRFVCEVCNQETEEETQELADFILNQLKK